MGKLMELKEETEQYLYDNYDCLSLHQIGELTDIIKDLSKSIYYCTQVKKEQEEDDTTELLTTHTMDLSTYMTQLNDDIITMLHASPSEKSMVVNKLTALITKIQTLV